MVATNDLASRLEDEILNPLTVIKISADQVKDGEYTDLEAEMGMIIKQAEKIQSAVHSFTQELRG